MSKSWRQIAERYHLLSEEMNKSQLSIALVALERLADSLDRYDFAQGLHPWTSMFDLCVQQGDADPYSGPYLRLSPQTDGTIEFRYIDTHIEARQWRRVETPETSLARFGSLVAQLHWKVSLS